MVKSTFYRNFFGPISKKKISDEVYEQLISLISSGKLIPGQQLPPERVLARELNVSRQSIREALKKAESKGLITVRQGEGTFVLPATTEWMEIPLLAMMAEEIERVYEFIEIRKLIEVECARRAAEFVNRRELKKMEKALSQMEKLIDSKEILGQPDIDFHIAIAEASHNTLMVHLMASIKKIFHLKFKISNFTSPPGTNIILIKQHREIYEAIKMGNPDLARHKMENHLQFVENEWRENVRRQGYRKRAKVPSRTSDGAVDIRH